MTDQPDVLTFGELKPKEKRGLFWGLLWRGLVASACVYLGGFVIGAILGFVTVFTMRSMGYDQSSAMHAVPFASAAAGFIWGIWFGWLYLHWILRIRIGQYGLRVARFDVAGSPT